MTVGNPFCVAANIGLQLKNSINGQWSIACNCAINRCFTGRKTKETQILLLRLVALYGCIIFASFCCWGKKFWQIATVVFSLTNFRSQEKDVFLLPEESEVQNKRVFPRVEQVLTSSDD